MRFLAVFLALFYCVGAHANEVSERLTFKVSGGEISMERQGDDSRIGFVREGLTCFTCGPTSYVDNNDCTRWDVTFTYGDYTFFNFLCGCTSRVLPDTQCRRFVDDAVNRIELFAAARCGVHLRCRPTDLSAQPGSHRCAERCVLGPFGCNAVCTTNCFYSVTCDALGSVPGPIGGGDGGKKKKKTRTL